ncbi:MAG TPA: long-chain-fatty-acid--CoA ligase [Candidatus Melainabacteria bacterium]|nr:long-chain-fatty-acid--CoA ligase [Candidatus Melainabacteria bacterium]HIN64611.1 long-chain-fatty-acid--CoA ligase [Candidatus Obscuribacterales bacterium]
MYLRKKNNMNSWNATSASHKLPMSQGDYQNVAEILASQAEVQPKKVAVRYQGVSYSYGRLYATSLDIVSALFRVGVVAADKVGIIFPNHPDFISAFFAVSSLGGTVVPINPLLKADEIKHILSDSEAKVLVVHESTAGEVADAVENLPNLEHVFVLTYGDKGGYTAVSLGEKAAARVKMTQLCMSYVSESASSSSFFGKITKVDPETDLAVLVYTSGTTGKPKGAMLTHKNLLGAVTAAHAAFPVHAEDRLLGALPLCHIYGLTVVMLGTIHKGGSLALIEKFDVVPALKTIEEEKVTVLPAVPTMYQYMIMHLEKQAFDLSSLRLCLAGGAPLSKTIFDSLRRFVKAPLVEGYGLTEVSCVATLNPVDGKNVHGSVGPAIPTVSIGIFDKDGQQLPPGAENVGEIAIKGPNVMRGYYRAPQKSAEVLKDGWFFTGDLGYLDSDQYLWIVGRAKELIIRGGQNIYPREVESVIAKMKGVVDVAVVGVPEPIMGERVKAVVVLDKSAQVTEEDVKEFCQKRLADYKVPRVVEFIDTMPRNSTGKILKSQLVQK